MKNIFKKYYEYVLENHDVAVKQYAAAAEKTFSGKMNSGIEKKKDVPFKVTRKDA